MYQHVSRVPQPWQVHCNLTIVFRFNSDTPEVSCFGSIITSNCSSLVVTLNNLVNDFDAGHFSTCMFRQPPQQQRLQRGPQHKLVQ
eukprot:m.346539 g.346539  ORF g.346539 m.346539 type:complete len:86 (+) comp29514_c0_seq1:1567-1824(+)